MGKALGAALDEISNYPLHNQTRFMLDGLALIFIQNSMDNPYKTRTAVDFFKKYFRGRQLLDLKTVLLNEIDNSGNLSASDKKVLDQAAEVAFRQ